MAELVAGPQFSTARSAHHGCRRHVTPPPHGRSRRYRVTAGQPTCAISPPTIPSRSSALRPHRPVHPSQFRVTPQRGTITLTEPAHRCEMNDHNTLDASGQTRRPHSDQWYRLLTEGHAPLVRARRVFRYLPSAPRCKMCNNPFGRPVGRILGVAGFKPSLKNPDLCTRCCDAVPHGGAEVDIAVLL